MIVLCPMYGHCPGLTDSTLPSHKSMENTGEGRRAIQGKGSDGGREGWSEGEGAKGIDVTRFVCA